jgi:cystathionine beta-lyase/cystathionine gamma-synthase
VGDDDLRDARPSKKGRRMASITGANRFYSRYGNPTVRGFEEAIADLEHAEDARAFASGYGRHQRGHLGLCSKATTSSRRSSSTRAPNCCCSVPARASASTSPSSMEPSPALSPAAVRPGKTQLVFAETPANPKLAIVDLEELGAIKGPMTVVDSTFATPLAQRPLQYGVDLVLHSATKAIAGHNDATLGVVAGQLRVVAVVVGVRGSARSQRVALRRDERPARVAHARCADCGARPSSRNISRIFSRTTRKSKA